MRFPELGLASKERSPRVDLLPLEILVLFQMASRYQSVLAQHPLRRLLLIPQALSCRRRKDLWVVVQEDTPASSTCNGQC